MCVCIGHSHVTALQRGGALAGIPVDGINFWYTGGPDPFVRDDTGLHLRADLAERVRRGRTVLSTVGGSAHIMLGLYDHPRPFDFVLPSDPHLYIDERRELVPAEAVRAMVMHRANEYLEIFPIVARVATGLLIHLECPPPVADSGRARAKMPFDFFPGHVNIIGPKWLRYKLWRMHNEVVAEVCAGHGIRYLAAPGRAMDREGFLDLDYDEDGVHANAAYGAMVLEDLKGSM